MLKISPNWLSIKFPELSDITPLAQGGQKSVFSARHPVHESVVLKIVAPGQDREQMERELVAANAIAGSRVPIIFKHGNVDCDVGSCIWMLEQRIEGQSLRSVLSIARLKDRDVLQLALDIMGALAAAESVRIVHRDVKPDNIIRDLKGSFWLLDFGVSRHLGLNSLTNTSQAFGKGTLGYAPPEQLRNIKGEIDARADLFSLGVTLYEASSGINPFISGARSPVDVITRTERLVLPTLRLGISSQQAFCDLLASLTQKRRDRRPASVKFALEWISEIAAADNVFASKPQKNEPTPAIRSRNDFPQ